MQPDLIERRISLVATIGAVVVFLLFALLAPSGFPSFDEWKYFGIGYNIWAGRGLTTVFGGEFLLHGPIWSAVVTLPHVLFGTNSAAWGRILNGLSGAAIVALSAWFGWRIRPAAGALAAIAMVGILYLHDQSRTARLDVPAAAFALLYVAVGIEALRRNSVRWAIAAGAVFALGFLIKEIDLPFIPIPFFVSVLWGLSWVVIGRISAWTVADRRARRGAVVRAATPGLGACIALEIACLDPDTRRPRHRRARRHRPDCPAGWGRPTLSRASSAPDASCAATGQSGWSSASAARLAWAASPSSSRTARPPDSRAAPFCPPSSSTCTRTCGSSRTGWRGHAGRDRARAVARRALAAYWRRPQRRPMVDLIIAGICGAPW